MSYTVNLNTSGQLVNFKTFYEENEEAIKGIESIVIDNNKFYPLTLEIADGEKILSNKRTIYLHIREKEKKHYMITSGEYRALYDTYNELINATDVVIFINDDPDAPSEIKELKQYLNIN